MSNRPVKIIMTSIILALLIAAYVMYLKYRTTQANVALVLPGAVKIDTRSQPTLGNPNAPVHIVIFEDLKCMMCKRFNIDLLPKIKSQYINTGKAKYTVINLAFIPGSINAALTAQCLYAQKPQYFFQFVDYIYHHQGLENQNWTNIPNMLADAAKIPGIDTVALGVCVSTNQYASRIQDNLNQAIKIMKNGEATTPSVYINGILVRPLTMDNFTHVYNQVNQEK